MTQDITKKVEEAVADGGVIYEITIPLKKELLDITYRLYQAGKQKDEQAYFNLRTEFLELIYELQKKSASTLIQQTLEEETKDL